MRGEGPEPQLRPPGWLAGLRDVAGLRSLRTVDNLEFDLLAFLERPEAGALNRGEVHEHVVAPLALNESVALCVIEPLDLAGDAHTTCLPYDKRGGTRRIALRRQFRGRDGVQKKDRNMRPQNRRQPAQRQPVTLAMRSLVVNRAAREGQSPVPVGRARAYAGVAQRVGQDGSRAVRHGAGDARVGARLDGRDREGARRGRPRRRRHRRRHGLSRK